jgi:transcriptional regulator with XRE-family HTH domain
MDKSKKNTLGPRIRYYRKKRGITQESLTAKLQVQGAKLDRPMISKIENQERELNDFEIIAIANALRIDFNELFKDISI